MSGVRLSVTGEGATDTDGDEWMRVWAARRRCTAFGPARGKKLK